MLVCRPSPTSAATSAVASGSPEFTWQPAARPALETGRADRLAAAAELARRCVELGVQPPLRPVPAAKAPAPAQQALPSATSQPAVPCPQSGRLEALVEQTQQASSALANMVQGQSLQLAAQQQLLADVVQGLLFVGAKARGGNLAAGGAASRQATPGAATPVQPAAMKKSLTAPCAPAVKQQGAGLGPLHTKGSGTQHRGSSDEPAPWAVLASSPTKNNDKPADGPVSPPCSMLRVPVPPAAAGCAREHPSCPSEQASGSPAGTQSLQATHGPQLPCPTDDRSAAVEALLARRGIGSAKGQTRAGSGGPGQQPHGRPAWDDSTVVQPAPRTRTTHEMGASLRSRQLLGGLGPQLLLRELRLLQRRHTIAGSGTRAARQAMRQASRSLTAPPASEGAVCPAAPVGGSCRERLPRAKHSAAVGRQGRVDAAAAPAQPSPLPRPIQLQPCHRAAAANRAVERGMSATAEPAAATGHGNMRRQDQQQRQLHLAGGSAESAGEQVLPWQQLTEDDITAVCGSVCRQLLLWECGPSAPAVPAC